MELDSTYDRHEALRKRIIAELTEVGLDLAPLGYVSNVDLLYIMEQPRKNLTPELKTALENATHGLGYAKTRFAILSLDELRELLETRKEVSCTLSEAVEYYVQILDPFAVVNLEHSIAKVWPADLELRNATVTGPGRVIKLGFSKGRPVALVTDFFSCFAKQETKALAWMQMIPASRESVF